MRSTTALVLLLTAALPAPAQTAGDLFSPEEARLRAFEGGGQAMPGTSWSAGIHAGYLKVRDADRGTWVVGAAARLSFADMFGAEASIAFHQDEFADGDMTVTTYPVQLTGLFFPPLGDLQGVRPYALLGAGWYYSRTDFSGSLSGLDAETDGSKGIHVGLGVEVPLGGMLIGYADLRYVFIDEPGVDNSAIEEEEFDFWEFAIGANFRL